MGSYFSHRSYYALFILDDESNGFYILKHQNFAFSYFIFGVLSYFMYLVSEFSRVSISNVDLHETRKKLIRAFGWL